MWQKNRLLQSVWQINTKKNSVFDYYVYGNGDVVIEWSDKYDKIITLV